MATLEKSKLHGYVKKMCQKCNVNTVSANFLKIFKSREEHIIFQSFAVLSTLKTLKNLMLHKRLTCQKLLIPNVKHR